MKHHWDEYNSALESPETYKDFAFYSLISSAVGRKVWIGDANNKLFLNTYTLFVGGPGVGKSAILDRVRDVFFRINRDGTINMEDNMKKYPDNEQLAIPTGPDSTSKPSLVKLMTKLGTVADAEGDQYYHASIALSLSEFSSLFPSGMDPRDVIRFLTVIYDCKPYQAQTEKRGVESIMNGCLNLIAATQPAFMYDCFERKTLTEGMAARTWFIFEPKAGHRNFDGPQLTPAMISAKQSLLSSVAELTKLYGPISYDPEARERLKHWYEHESDRNRSNRSPKLVDYYERKRVHVQKLAAIIALARHGDLSRPIKLCDVEKAFAELLRIEKSMDLALSQKPRNELYEIHNIIEDLLNGGDMEVVAMYKQLVEFVNAREFAETLRSLIRMKKVKLVREDKETVLLTNRMDRGTFMNIFDTAMFLKEFETR